MGMNNEGARRFIIDIETYPIDGAADYLDPVEPIPEPDLSLVTAAKNLTDPVKVAADLEKRKQAAIEEYHEQVEQQARKRVELLERCALDLDLCRIVAVGWWAEDRPDPIVAVIDDGTYEAAILRKFWADVDTRVTIGYNQIGFDLPILLRRALYLGVETPAVNLDKYRSSHIDLQQRLSLNGTKTYRSLNWYAKRFKLAVPADPNSGKDIGQLVADGQWDAIAAHCRADLVKTRALAERMGLLQARPQLEAVL